MRKSALRFSKMAETRSGVALCVGLLALVLAPGCSQKDSGDANTSASKSETSAPAPAAAPVVDPATAATISGTVAFTGTAPKMSVIDVSSEATCHAHSADNPVYTQTAVVNPNGTLRYVFVYVKEGLGSAKFSPAQQPVELNQVGCRYEPHVFGIQVGQPLKIKNSDEGVLHNIHALSSLGNGFNFGMPKVMESTKDFKKPEVMVRIKCDVHGWMSSYAGVTEHPFFAVSGEDGSFALPALPPGTYVLEAWHEQFGAQTQTVTVAAQEAKQITFTFDSGS